MGLIHTLLLISPVFRVVINDIVHEEGSTAGFNRGKVNNPYIDLERPCGLQEIEASRISRESANEDSKVVSPTHRYRYP